jgi:hypothetical protein
MDLVAVVVEGDDRTPSVHAWADGLRVDGSSVVHLQEGLGQDLPVASKFDPFGVDDPERSGGHFGQHGGEWIEPVEEWLGLRVQVYEDPAPPGLAPHCGKPSLGLVQLHEVPFVGHSDQLAGQVVAPGVKLAGEHAGRATLAPDHRGSAVAAGVVEGPHQPVVASR